MLAADQARILESWRCSRPAQAWSKALACCCQLGSRVKAASVDPGDGGIPARKRAVSLALVVSAACVPGAAASMSMASATAPGIADLCFIIIVWRGPLWVQLVFAFGEGLTIQDTK